jgi:hypothetical protein
MQAGRSTIPAAIAAIVLIASLAGLWFVLPGNGEVRLTGETLTAFAREHPPKPWHGFETSIMDVSVDGEVRIKAHITGYMIHTPIVISGTPQFDAGARAMFFRVSKAELPREAGRPMLGRFNSMLSPLGSYIAKQLTDAFPVKKIKAETRGGALFLATVKSVRVDGNAVAVEVHGYHAATAAIALMLCALLAAGWLIAGLFRRRPSLPPQENASAPRRQG